MTEKQADTIASAIKTNYEIFTEQIARKAILSIMIDNINTTFDRNKFLEKCGHPNFQRTKD
jgi:hypothetical protein